jgi:LysM repeat protein
MSDSPKNDHEDFVISQDNDTEGEEELGRDENYGSLSGLLQNKSNLFYILGGLGLVIIAILFVLVLSGPSDVVTRQQLQALEEKIQGLEKRIATRGLIDQALDKIDKNEKEFNLIMERVDRFEGTVGTQIDQIIKELGMLHQKAGSAPEPTSKARPKTAKSTEEKRPRLHEVTAGETLYSISRRYGLTVDQLRTYNDIGPDAAIRPGQKLRLTANSGN